MTKPINPGTAILFLLKREYIRECRIETVANDQGEESDRAVHPNGWSFEQWLIDDPIKVYKQYEQQLNLEKIYIIK